MIKLGNLDVNLYVGNLQASAAYLGSSLVWSKSGTDGGGGTDMPVVPDTEKASDYISFSNALGNVYAIRLTNSHPTKDITVQYYVDISTGEADIGVVVVPKASSKSIGNSSWLKETFEIQFSEWT